MDDIDRRILQRLRQNGHATNAEIGAAIGLTEGAVRHRVHQMRRDGVILRYTIIARPLGPEGIVLVRCTPGETARVVERLAAIVPDLYETSGAFDLAVAVESETMAEFNRDLDRVRSIPGVEETLTLIRLTRFVGGPGRPPMRGAKPGRPSERTGRSPER